MISLPLSGADLSKFDTMDHAILMCRVARKIRGKRVLQLISKTCRPDAGWNGELNYELPCRLRLR